MGSQAEALLAERVYTGPIPVVAASGDVTLAELRAASFIGTIPMAVFSASLARLQITA
jgi:hypothetical protein